MQFKNRKKQTLWRKKIFLLPALLSLILILNGCKSLNHPPISTTTLLLDTVVTIELYETDNESLLQDCVKICQDYENKLSRTITTSEVFQINNSNGKPVKVSNETATLIQKGLDYGKLSNGYFDITIAPLSSLWDFKNNSGHLPSSQDIEAAKHHVNYKNVIVDGNTVTLTDPDSSIDLGGIAKGYIADQLKQYLESKGIKHGIINLGGNILTIGNKSDGTAYHIGIKKPFEEDTAIISVDVIDKSVVSSGIYERYFKLNGKIYHHILNPFTGYPLENNLLQVTIISDQSVDGDALSTTCFALGLDEGLKLVHSFDHIDAIFVTSDGKIHRS